MFDSDKVSIAELARFHARYKLMPLEAWMSRPPHNQPYATLAMGSSRGTIERSKTQKLEKKMCENYKAFNPHEFHVHSPLPSCDQMMGHP